MGVDNFKQCNDRFGHQVGDIIVRETAVLLRKEIRKYDIACRYEGEEFAIILPATGLLQAKNLAERLRTKIAGHTVEVANCMLSITVSQGVAEFDSETDKGALIKQADMALYKAKKEGKNRVVMYLAEM